MKPIDKIILQEHELTRIGEKVKSQMKNAASASKAALFEKLW